MKPLTRILLSVGAVILLVAIYFSGYFYYSSYHKLDTVPTATSTPVAIDPIKVRLEKMTLEEKVGQMLLAGIYTEDGQEVLERLISERKIGSIILMGPNIKNKRVVDVTTRLQSIAASTNQPPLIISIDQEGGIVSRIKDPDSDLTSQPDIKDAEQAYKVANDRGIELYNKGVNVNFSPVLEYITNKNSFLYNRVFRGTKEDDISFGSMMVRGYQDAGIAATIKHFPGHDDSSVDSHKNLPTSKVTPEDLREHARPFAEVIKNSDPMMVMTAHVLFPKIDPIFPATLSPTIINILRNDYKFDGVIITDDMNMGAITKSFGIETSAVQAILAGNDILLYVATEETVNKAYNAILTAIKTGQLTEDRIDQSVYRILKLKQKVVK
jgi:beta-N-acetylhexosaminidase